MGEGKTKAALAAAEVLAARFDLPPVARTRGEAHLWDDEAGAVAAGVNWAPWDDSIFDEPQYLSVIGPEFDEQPAQRDW